MLGTRAILAGIIGLFLFGDAWGESNRPPPIQEQIEAPSPQPAQPATPDQRGTDQSPFTVKVIPSPEAEKRAEKEEQERAEKTRIDKKIADETQRVADETELLRTYTGGLAIFTLFLFLAAVGQISLFWIQLSYMKTGLRDAAVAATAAADTARAVVDNERPWVGPITTSSKQITPGEFIDATVVIQNSGNTPALDMRAAFIGSIKLKTVSADKPDIAQAPPKALFPNIPDWYYPFGKNLILSREDFDAIRDGDKIAWIIGRIEYLDNRRRHRYTNISTRWDQSRGVFVPHETGNDAT